MSDAFTAIMQRVTLPSEGGLSDDPRDPGGLTNRGLTLPDLRRFSRGATAADLRALTEAETMGVYLSLYWLPVQGASLSPPIACMVFDHGVNAGIGDSARILQRIVNVEPDGWIGPLTLAAVTSANTLALVAQLRSAQEADYRSKGDATAFLDGWLVRLALRTHTALTL